MMSDEEDLERDKRLHSELGLSSSDNTPSQRQPAKTSRSDALVLAGVQGGLGLSHAFESSSVGYLYGKAV